VTFFNAIKVQHSPRSRQMWLEVAGKMENAENKTVHQSLIANIQLTNISLF